MTKYILIGFLSLSSLCFGNQHVSDRYPYKIQDKEFLLTFPKSGTNFTASLIQLLTKKPLGTMGRTGMFFRHSLNPLNLQLDMQKPAVHLSHCFGSMERNFFSKIDTTKNKLIMTIRNPKECIVRHHRFSEEQFICSVLNNTWGFREYIHLLQIYDN